MSLSSITKIIWIFLFCIVIPKHAFSQLYLSGVVLDYDTKDVIPFASIFLKNNQLVGTLSNELGEFKIKVSNDVDLGELAVTYLGFENKYVEIKDIEDKSNIVIELRKTMIEIEEIVVYSDIGLRRIINKCYENVAEKYGSNEHYLDVYFRRYTTKYQVESHIKEGFFTIEDDSYISDNRRDMNSIKIWMRQYRESDDNRGFRFLDDGPNNNFIFTQYCWYNLMRSRRYSWLGCGRNDSENNYTYSYRGTYIDAQDTILRIGFECIKSKESSSAYLYSGEYLINTADDAIIQVQMGQNRDDFIFDLKYRKHEGKYYPEIMLLVLGLGGEDDSSLDTHWLNSLLYFYNVSDEKKLKKDLGKRIYQDVPVDSKTVDYDERFWNDVNEKISIPTSMSLETAIGNIKSLEEQYKSNSRRVINDN